MKKQSLKGWKELAIGGLILEAGNSVEYESGSWSPQKLIFYKDRCIQCLQCWIYCPDNSIIVKEGKVIDVDHFHCKACGICITHCPTEPKSLELVMEEESLKAG